MFSSTSRQSVRNSSCSPAPARSCCCRISHRPRSRAASTWATRSSSISRPSWTATARRTGCCRRCYSPIMRTTWFSGHVGFVLAVALALPPIALAEDRSPDAGAARAQSVVAHDGMVVAQEARAARIGVDVLQKGGNAVDAAVAVGFALAVTYPRAGNIGGGGFMVIHLANGGDTAIDYRETAPAGINAKSFLDAAGNADPQKSRDSALAIGVPGTVAGLALAEEKYGSGQFTLAELMAPAMAMAQDGITLTGDDLADLLPAAQARLAHWPATASIFLKGDGS